MRYADIIANDVVNGEGVSVSLFVQGCHKHCPGCFNSETWDFNGGKEIYSLDLLNQILNLLQANGIKRNFSILGGEPFAEENLIEVATFIQVIRDVHPNIKIWVWTGYTIEELQAMNNSYVNEILDNINVLVDGPYIEAERDPSLPHCGSRNQRVIKLR
ncbi:MAG: anaerobic ribonucleoside-triphosphate reductase activating protein [Ruminococcus sp.]|nr:anaerobic ribonucleoside-triphosphate reductase activating protein [Ruminococcus sp.]